MNPFVEYSNIIPLLAPVDKVSTAYALPWVDLKNANAVRFFVYCGALTSATEDHAHILVQCSCEAGSDSEAAIAYNYRKSGAAGANTWGAITAALATGYPLTTVDDGFMICIEVSPSVALNGNTNKNGRYVRLEFGAWSDTIAASLIAVWAEIDPIYKQATFVSTTGAT
jgi:hypothetical protein